MTQMTVGMCQINAGFSGHVYLPYSTGLLEAYARRHLREPHDFSFGLPVYKREKVEIAVRQLIDSDVVGFSLYVWNAGLSLAIARELKHRRPEIRIIAGGPHVPNPPDSKKPELGPNRGALWMGDHPYIDFAMHGEGEQAFCSFLEHLRGGNPEDWSDVPSLSYRHDANIIHTPRAARMKELDEVPSPYLDGTFDSLMTAHPDNKWIAIWETNRGCPFSCTFCDWGSATAAKVNKWEEQRVYREMDWFAKHRTEFIFLADANFGILPRDVALAQYCADVKARTGYPVAITVSNTKNATDRSFEVQRIFAISGLNTGATLSMQSLDTDTLKAIERDNISLDSYRTLQARFKQVGIQANTDIILCLPGETYDSFTRGVDELMRNGQHDRVLFYNLTILPNAKMGDPAYQKLHGMEMVPSRIINIHGNKPEDDEDVLETQQLVVATRTMDRSDWIRTRVFSWTAQFLHFDKILQIPFVVAHTLTGIPYRDLIGYFSDGLFGDPAEFPTLTAVRNFFVDKAKDIQSGGAEFCHSKEWLDIWWPTDEYMLIDLVRSVRLASFYEEAERTLAALCEARGYSQYADVIREAVRLNGAMLKIPFRDDLEEISLSANVWDFYLAARGGEPIPLERRSVTMTVDRSTETWADLPDWCRRMVWYSSKRGAYLYGITARDEVPAGIL